MTRFELATPRPPDVCATGLRYIPNYCKSIGNYNADSFGNCNINKMLVFYLFEIKISFERINAGINSKNFLITN